LGLAFCKRVMHSFNGEITCISEKGRYTKFILEFPALDKSHLNQYESRLYSMYSPVFSGKRVLLAGVPDEYAPILKRLLTPLNIERDEAPYGNEALKMIADNRYDLVLAHDSLLPFGIAELTKSIRNTGNDIPVIACSSSIIPVTTKSQGIDATVFMPPILSELLPAMKTAIETDRATLKESLSGKTVLVADDLDFNRRVIKSMLNKLGLTILEANNGLEAIEILKSHSCDLVIIDMRMPVLDGFETTKRIRSEPSSYRDIPVLGLSGNLDNLTMKMVKESGINESLIKPLKLKVFLEKVSEMLKIGQPA
jgi:two-component system CAI-1 autoinducer sensor kinase/phosphatase CqsS